MRGLTKVAAMELGRKGFRVNSVQLGGVDTVLTDHSGTTRDEMNKSFDYIPLQRFGAPDEAAVATAFLASEESLYVQGAAIVIDGGMTVRSYYIG